MMSIFNWVARRSKLSDLAPKRSVAVYTLLVTYSDGSATKCTREYVLADEQAPAPVGDMWSDILNWFGDDNGSATFSLTTTDGLVVFTRASIARIDATCGIAQK